ncbi:MAG: A/G-specific adenine glycosylase [Euryarchaeota archaeon]|nr:A/G-specific adenine glycosylase [Euryarchaeota archaeon]MDE2043811.1 A/G-specific adenine glycosylase [Thermoplasmata archaeon]
MKRPKSARWARGVREVGDRLVAWFEREALDLPWRRTRDPYRIWVAEVLLQQTRVEQARPYYGRFLAAFPTIEELAQARREEVLKVWEGAGYYARAHRLHEAAQFLIHRRQGKLPSEVEEMEQLPGFGPYTSRAVAAIAFGVPVVALDANALRVLARLFLIDPSGGKTAPRAEALGRQALGGHPPRAFNEALMELGQRYCTARSPRCGACPLARRCAARQELPDPGAFPPRRPRPVRPRVEAAVGLLEREGRWLVGQRPPGGLLGGLWEFPGGKLKPGESAEAAIIREFREEAGLRTSVVEHLGDVEHDYSHFHATLHVFRLAGTKGTGHPLGVERTLRWVTARELPALPLPTATCKMLVWVSPRTSRGSGSRRGRSSASGRAAPARPRARAHARTLRP